LQTKTKDIFAGPLSGTKVLDFTEVLSGPFCTQVLADLGAEVIKVEPPSGDGTRKWGPPFVSIDSSYYLSLNRNKKSIVIDLSNGNEKGRKVALRLAQKCDVLVESFRPGVMSKLKLGYGDVKKVNPGIIYCSISGYGQTGPLSHKPGYDIAAYASSGIMSITGQEQGEPVKTGVPMADLGAAQSAALAISVALFQRERKNTGTYIDISLYDTMISYLSFQAGCFFATGKNPKKLGSAHPLLVPYQAFKAKDRYFILAVGNDAIWQRACKAMKLEELANDKQFDTGSHRLKHRKEIVEILSNLFQKKTAKHWIELFDKAGVPSDAIKTVKEALESKQTKQRNLVLKIARKSGERISTLASPIRFNVFGNSRQQNSFPPLLGENSISILKEFGFSKPEIKKLVKEKVVVS
jgi:crotonobetainyl-CoA:carnitine CoA-transferase CaiB-like acyl-CoA transferase